MDDRLARHFKPSSRRCRLNSLALLRAVDEFLQSRCIRYFVDFGTLLGLVRDGDLIPWDSDIDISIIDVDLFDKLIRESPFRLAGVRPRADVWICPPRSRPWPRRIWTRWCWPVGVNAADNFWGTLDIPIERATLAGVPVSVPVDRVAWLDQEYPNWRTRVKQYEWRGRRWWRPGVPAGNIVVADLPIEDVRQLYRDHYFGADGDAYAFARRENIHEEV